MGTLLTQHHHHHHQTMIRSILIILFTGLYVLNSHICSIMIPMYQEDYEQFLKWYYLRDTIYEWMFLVLVVMVFTRRTLFADSVTFSVGVLVLCSLSDKILVGNRSLTIKDLLVIIPASAFCGCIYYLYKRSNVKTFF